MVPHVPSLSQECEILLPRTYYSNALLSVVHRPAAFCHSSAGTQGMALHKDFPAGDDTFLWGTDAVLLFRNGKEMVCVEETWIPDTGSAGDGNSGVVGLGTVARHHTRYRYPQQTGIPHDCVRYCQLHLRYLDVALDLLATQERGTGELFQSQRLPLAIGSTGIGAHRAVAHLLLAARCGRQSVADGYYVGAVDGHQHLPAYPHFASTPISANHR